MPSLKQEAENYEVQKLKNISDLDKVAVNLNVQERIFTNSKNEEFKVKVIVVDGEEYRVPNSVLSNLKVILKNMPNLKNFKVIKEGDGMGTTYTAIPME